jgi:uncharacterized membrane protein YedE/YeeE
MKTILTLGLILSFLTPAYSQNLRPETVNGTIIGAIAGAIIGLIVPLLLIIGNKTFGLSSNLRHICAACFPANIKFFKYNWKNEIWNLFFVVGIIIGAFIATHYLSNPNAIVINEKLKLTLTNLGVTDFQNLMPSELFSLNSLSSIRGFVLMVVGGFLVGFGTRYANGCTSGHAIMGLSNLQWPSLVATICFMLGGFIMTNFILPFILQYN